MKGGEKMKKEKKTAPDSHSESNWGQSWMYDYDVIISDCEQGINTTDALRETLRKESDPSYLVTKTMSEICAMEISEPIPIVVDILYPGTYIFAGPPKVGKSLLMLQMAYHICTDTPLWGFPVTQGKVLYFALEDKYRRLKYRFLTMFSKKSDDLYIALNAHKIDDGFIDQVRRFVNENPDTKLVVIDVFQMIKGSTGGEYSYANDYQIISALKSLSDELNIAIVIVHHTRKSDSNDVFNTISGTTGLQGAVDGMLVMSKSEFGSSYSTLDIIGRDQESKKLYLKRNTENLVWEIDEFENEMQKDDKDSFLESIAELLPESTPSFTGSATEIVELLKLNMSPITLSRTLRTKSNKLKKVYGINCEFTNKHNGRKITFYR